MLSGKKLGVISSIIGISIGAYFAMSPIISNYSLGFSTSGDIGLQSAIIGSVVGLSFALIGVISNSQQTNT